MITVNQRINKLTNAARPVKSKVRLLTKSPSGIEIRTSLEHASCSMSLYVLFAVASEAFLAFLCEIVIASG